MPTKTLRDVLLPPEESGTLRWRAAVPLVTNPFILLELIQFAFVGAAVVLVSLCIGVWLTEGGLALTDIRTAFSVAGLVFSGILAGFAFLVIMFFGNRYFAAYRMDATGIYYESSRGEDENSTLLSLAARPFPVTGTIKAGSTKSRELPWDKVDRFQAIPSMRVIVLRRGMWHMMRLYLPDETTFNQVERRLETRLHHQPPHSPA